MTALLRRARTSHRSAARALLLVAAVAAPAALAASPAQAAPPIRVKISAAFDFSTMSCGFLVTAAQSGGDATLREFSNGRQIITAAADTVLTLTGPTGRSLVVRTSGPTSVDASSARIVLTGWTFLDAITGRAPGLYSGTGRSVIDLTTGSVRATGHFVDVCPALAP
jgi:hypothetical protein